MRIASVVVMLLLSASTLPGASRRIFMHLAVETDNPPVVDGVLDEPCWQKAPAFILKTPPNSKMMTHNVNETGTTVKLLHDRDGIYAGIVCRQENLDLLKASIKSRDGGNVWADDSVELFFSPLLSNINYYKFEINSLGVFSDLYRYDAVLTYRDWNALNVRSASGRLPDAWTVEFFVSWKDLDVTHNPGGLIGFQMTRFMWKGSELHVNGSSGGNYARPNMGYVYLAPKDIPSTMEIARKTDALIPTGWYNIDDDEKWIYSDKKNIVVKASAEMEKMFRSDLDAEALRELDKIEDAGSRFQRILEMRGRVVKEKKMRELESLLD